MRRPRILIHMEDPRRDGPVLIALARLFEKAGARALLSTRRTTNPILNALPCEAAVIATPMNIIYDTYPKITRRTKIYMLATEGAVFEEGPLLVKYGGGSDPDCWQRHIQSIHRFFLWGDYSRRVLLATGRFREEQLPVTGAPRMDFFLAAAQARKPLGAQRVPIGVVSSFPLFNSIVPESMLKKIDLHRGTHWGFQSKARYFEDRLWIEASYLRVLLTFFDECRRRGQRVWLRPHQQEDRRSWRYFEDRYSPTLHTGGEELPFESWLDQIQLMAGFNSTTFFEAVAAGKPALNLTGLVGPRLAEHTDHFQQNHYPIIDHLKVPETWDEVFAFVNQIQPKGPGEPFEHSAEAQAILRDVCHFPRPVSALSQLVHTVLADLGQPPSAEEDSRWREPWVLAQAKALEAYTFKIRRDPIGNCWFPLQARRLAGRFEREIQRYLLAAQGFPAGAKAPQLAAEKTLCLNPSS
ncbi:MAG: hypothetical protein HYS41_01375 [Candidatus Omnitrophica bacterium]|nr:hypothetical protein [Candidatus Omnitrophota bacterium]